MLVAAGKTACAHLRMGHADIEQGNGVIGNGLGFFAVQPAEGGVALQRRHSDVLLRRQLQKQPLLLAVLGEKTDAVFDGRARGVDHYRLAVDLNHAARGFTHAEDKLCQLGTSGPDQSRQPDDFAGTHLQAARLYFFTVGEVVDVETRAAEGNITLLVEQVA